MGVQCAEAVLRGADVFAPGVMATPKGIAHISVMCGCVQVCEWVGSKLSIVTIQYVMYILSYIYHT